MSPDHMVAEKLILSHLSQHPEIMVSLLENLGGNHITHNSTQIRSTCPIHHGDGRTNFVIWYDRGIPIWKCLSRQCGNGGPITRLPAVLYNIPMSQSIEFLGTLCGIPVPGLATSVPDDVLDQILARNNITCKVTDGNSDVFNKIELFPEYMVSDALVHKHTYWNNRHYPQDILDKFQVGYVPAYRWWFPSHISPKQMRGWREDRTCIPIRTKDGRLIGFSGRRVDDVNFAKYLILEGTVKTETLYGCHLQDTMKSIRDTGELIVVEGYSDVWRAHQFGVFNAVAVMGSDLSERQLGVIQEISPSRVIVYLDNDETGREKSSVFRDTLSTMSQVECVFSPNGDPGDNLNRKDFVEPLATCNCKLDVVH